MQGRTKPHEPKTLKTATAAADPVIIRLSTPAAHIVLLAADATYEKDGMIHLHAVRWAKAARSLKTLLRMPRTFEAGACDRLRLRKTPQDIWAALPQQVSMRVPADARGFGMSNLSYVQYEAYRTASPRRLMQAAHQLVRMPRRRPLAITAAALHRLRFALLATLVPRVAR